MHHAPPGPISWIVIAVSFTCLFSFEVLCAVKLGIYHVGIIHLSADTPCTEYKLLTILNDLLIFFLIVLVLQVSPLGVSECM